MERFRWHDAPLPLSGRVNRNPEQPGKITSCTCAEKPPAVGVPAMLEKMNRDNAAFWEGREKESDVTPGRENGIPAQLEAMNERNRRFWESRT
jgi:hypothetical protein